MTNGLRGRTNGLTNGLGRTNGLTNGLTNGVGRTNGLTNGLGRTNGLTNGLGRTNGLGNNTGRSNGRRKIVRITNGLSLRANTYGIVASSDIRRTGAFIALSVVAMLLLAYFLGSPTHPPSPFAVDGNFSEWANVPLYTYDADAARASGDLVAYGFHYESGQLFVYGKTVGPLFAGSQPSVVYLEVEDPTRVGYAVSGFDASYIAEFWGSNNMLEGAAVRAWSGASDRDNASALRTIQDMPVAVVGNQFEMAVSDYGIDFSTIPGLRLRLVSEFADQTDSGATVGLLVDAKGQVSTSTSGALIVDQSSQAAVVSATTAVLQLRMRALVTALEVSNISVTQSGGGKLLLPALPLTIPAGQEQVVQVSVDVSALPPLRFVTFEVLGVTARPIGGGPDVPVTIAGHGVRTYAQARPAGHIVDGLFDDWPVTIPDPLDFVPASIDIRASAFAVNTDAFFYVRTQGDVMTGTIVPERRVPLASMGNGSGPPVAPTRRAGEDLLQIFVDSGAQRGVGPVIGGINADRLVEARGRAGRITWTAAYAWNASTWTWEPRTDLFKVAFVGAELEASIASSFFTPTNNSRVVYAMSDWSGDQDRTDVPIPRSAPSLMAAAPSPLHALIPNNITANPLVNTPTVDGNCASSPGEYSGASIGSNGVITFAIGSRNDTQDIYVCIRVTADTSANNQDWGEVIFDTLHNGGIAPQVDDKLFWLFGNGDNVLKAWQGTGTGWNGVCPACDPGNVGRSRFSGTNEFYEFRIHYTDVWATLAPTPGQVAGFAIIAFDFKANALYTWGGDAVQESVPNTWGHVFFPIPEFPSTVLVAAGALLLPIATRRLRRARLHRKGLSPRWQSRSAEVAKPLERARLET